MNGNLSEIRDLPVIRINLPVNSSFSDSIKSLRPLLKLYKIPSPEAMEMEEKITGLFEDFELKSKQGRVDLEIIPQKRNVELEISVKEENIKKNLAFNFFSKRIKILYIKKRGRRIKIKLSIFLKDPQF